MSRAPIGMTIDHRGLHALDAYSQEQLAALPHGTYNVRFAKMTGKYKEEREGMRGLWWAGLELLVNNTERRGYADKRQAHETILRAIGYTRPRFRADHSFELIPISTSEESMDDAEFAIMQERARAFCMEEHGFDPFEMWKEEQEAMNGGRR